MKGRRAAPGRFGRRPDQIWHLAGVGGAIVYLWAEHRRSGGKTPAVGRHEGQEAAGSLSLSMLPWAS